MKPNLLALLAIMPTDTPSRARQFYQRSNARGFGENRFPNMLLDRPATGAATPTAPLDRHWCACGDKRMISS